MDRPARVGRRLFLGSVAAALAGCSTVRSAVNGEGTNQVSLSIKTTPDDDDPYAIRIARHLSQHLEAVGIQTEVTPMRTEQLLQSLLVAHDFDLYVARHPGGNDPDFLRPFLQSGFATGDGWYNPFGLADLDVDRLLDRQRYEQGGRRRATISDLQWEIARSHPFAVVCHPDIIHAVRADRARNWPPDGIRTPGDLLGLLPATDGSLDELRIAVRDPRPTRNRNPLSFEYRDRGLFMGLIYEPLARIDGGRLRPRLAREWSWTDEERGSSLSLSIRDARWHDGTAITASDVAFTYRFLSDTTLGNGDVPVPAPRYRGRTSLVSGVTAEDDRTVRLRIDASRDVGRRVLTLPILPRHEWEPRTDPTAIGDIGLQDGVTQALTWENPEPVGSGPLAFEQAAVDEALVLTRFEDHFVEGVIPYERLSFRVVPSGEAAVELVIADEVDATGPLDASQVPRIARADDAALLTGQTDAFYHVGYNARHEDLNNPRFRRAVSALLDRETVQSEIFDGFASPAVSPLRDGWVAPGLEWGGTAPVAPFPRDGDSLDVSAARGEFETAGYYFDDGRMVK